VQTLANSNAELVVGKTKKGKRKPPPPAPSRPPRPFSLAGLTVCVAVFVVLVCAFVWRRYFLRRRWNPPGLKVRAAGGWGRAGGALCGVFRAGNPNPSRGRGIIISRGVGGRTARVGAGPVAGGWGRRGGAAGHMRGAIGGSWLPQPTLHPSAGGGADPALAARIAVARQRPGRAGERSAGAGGCQSGGGGRAGMATPGTPRGGALGGAEGAYASQGERAEGRGAMAPGAVLRDGRLPSGREGAGGLGGGGVRGGGLAGGCAAPRGCVGGLGAGSAAPAGPATARERACGCCMTRGPVPAVGHGGGRGASWSAPGRRLAGPAASERSPERRRRGLRARRGAGGRKTGFGPVSKAATAAPVAPRAG
jgi:hypothetical protein